MVERRRRGRNEEFGAGQHAGARGFRVQHRARAQHHLIAQTVGHFFQSTDGARDGHGDLGGAHSAVVNGFHGLNGAFCAGNANDREQYRFR